MKIGEKTISMMSTMAAEQLKSYTQKINEAFLKSEDEKLKISLSFDIAVSETKVNAVDIDATITFTADKIKNKVSSTVTENQAELFKAVESLRPKAGSGIDSITISSGDKSVTLEAKEG